MVEFFVSKTFLPKLPCVSTSLGVIQPSKIIFFKFTFFSIGRIVFLPRARLGPILRYENFLSSGKDGCLSVFVMSTFT